MSLTPPIIVSNVLRLTNDKGVPMCSHHISHHIAIGKVEVFESSKFSGGSEFSGGIEILREMEFFGRSKLSRDRDFRMHKIFV